MERALLVGAFLFSACAALIGLRELQDVKVVQDRVENVVLRQSEVAPVVTPVVTAVPSATPSATVPTTHFVPSVGKVK